MQGPAGSIRALALHPRSSPRTASSASASSSNDGAPLIASVGLDRFLRVHSTSAGQAALSKVYLKQQLTGVAWLRPPVAEKEAAAGKEEDEGEERGFNWLAEQGQEEERVETENKAREGKKSKGEKQVRKGKKLKQ